MFQSQSAKFFLLLVVAMISWGFAWPSAKSIVSSEPAIVIVFWRFLATALSLVPILIWRKDSILLPDRKAVTQVLLGGILYTIYNQFFLLGLSQGLAGAGGVLVTTMNPILTYIMVHAFQRKLPGPKELFGLCIGLLGGFLLLKIWEGDWTLLFQSGNVYFLLCAFSWAILSMNSHSAGQKISPMVYSFYVFAVGTFIDFFLAFPYDLKGVFDNGLNFWIQLLYLSVISTTFGTTVYFYASSRLGSRTASSFIFLVPVTALLGSWVFLGEVPSLSTLLGGLLAIGSVFILNGNHSKKEEVADPAV
ncbi:DMT family transporter [Leptospira langatensis]|uniref:DMT family transporter n=1 Tax=Leptospira langatensis TaxID=2484983 RepID=A0A5F1ZNR1_9LEPT|nr:DMT family transporter [Leptospira langatensis]TGK05299.1 DMT family transporter [Leptospira langatensis]TGL38435.1 DMT family transporter [Leptospira langatensis]